MARQGVLMVKTDNGSLDPFDAPTRLLGVHSKNQVGLKGGIPNPTRVEKSPCHPSPPRGSTKKHASRPVCVASRPPLAPPPRVVAQQELYSIATPLSSNRLRNISTWAWWGEPQSVGVNCGGMFHVEHYSARGSTVDGRRGPDVERGR